ncbi:ras-related protein Rab-26 isoform X3 [Bactrocera neohumeralis]|uniref:ras-related protein Rab-26 isoform X3 n=1 Tax=Bactrocera tryoni TaxID=59916 RepID=UPI001A97F047|nr:ras-related protein Rab-26 isoform X3 [Bactrocera tryoni]XP_050336590.1 ras-related protein Rab-26 isoform X3 [Bactrocera neohumeralis]
MSHIPDDASSMSDDVFEDPETTQRRLEETARYRANYATSGSGFGGGGSSGIGSSLGGSSSNAYSTGYPGYRPPVKALQMYALEDAVFHGDGEDDEYEDGWRSYRYDEVGMYCQPPQPPFDDTVNHKTILLGDSGVGKTSFLVKYNTGEFRLGSFSATVGIALTNKVVVVDGTRVKLQIWDTAGQERFRSVTHTYYRDAHALLLLYDVTNKTTYDNIRAWLGEIRDYTQDDVVIVLIGNKADCSNSERQVKREDGERLAREHNVPFMETSAKTGLNVELAFSAVARQLKCRGTVNGDDGKFNVHDYVRDNTQARTMCAQCKSM